MMGNKGIDLMVFQINAATMSVVLVAMAAAAAVLLWLLPPRLLLRLNHTSFSRATQT